MVATLAAWAAVAAPASADGMATVATVTGVVVDHPSGRVYWADFHDNTIAFANLDGSGSGTLDTTGATINQPEGLVLDPASRRLYWINDERATNSSRVSYVNLDGSGGGGDVPGSENASGPLRFTIANGVAYWSTFFAPPGIRFVRLDGQGGVQTLPLSGPLAALDGNADIAVDPNGNRIYWVASGGSAIASATLAGTPGTDIQQLSTAPVAVANPTGLQFDPTSRRLYWYDNGTKQISYASVDGPGAGTLASTHDTAFGAGDAIAVDPQTGRVYWSNIVKIQFANLDGSGAATQLFPFPPPIDTSLRAPVIDDAPPSSTPLTDASLLYHAVDQGVTLSCALDGGVPSACTGRSSFAHLAVGRHCFSASEHRNGRDGPATNVCWTVTQLAAGCQASFHHGYFIAAGAATVARRLVVFHATSDGVAGRIGLQTQARDGSAIRVAYALDGKPLSSRPQATIAFAQLDRTRSHTLTVTITNGHHRARIARGFRYASFVSVACGGRQVVGRIAPRTVRLGGARVTIAAQVPKDIRGTSKLRFTVTADHPHALRAVHFTFAGKALTQHALNAALTAQQLSADGTQMLAIALVPLHGRTVTVRVAFRTRSD
jgi:hypothetical protein